MIMFFRLMLFCSCYALLIPAHAGDHINLVMPDFPPYTSVAGGVPQGIGVDLVKQVMADADVSYSLKMVKDYGLALYLLKKHLADAMFLATQNKERDAVATFSKPLLINRWCWFFNADSPLDPDASDFKQRAKIGTIFKTNTYKWLINHHFDVVGKPMDGMALHKMLRTGRINTVFVAEAVFEQAIPPDPQMQYIKVVALERPFGLYISKDYLAQHPQLLARINQAISRLPQDTATIVQTCQSDTGC